MQNRHNINLLSIFLPLLGCSLLFYATFYLTDAKSPLDRVAFVSVVTSMLFYYLFNVKLVSLSKRRGVFVLQIILALAVIFKAYYVRNILSYYHIAAGYGLLLIGIITNLVIFSKKHFKLTVHETFVLFTDKEEYVLGESVNVCVEITPKGSYAITKLEASLVMSENTSGYKNKIIDEISFVSKKTLMENQKINSYEKLDVSFEIPKDGMSSFYGIYNCIFWYVKLNITLSGRDIELTSLIDVKPEILIRELQK